MKRVKLYGGVAPIQVKVVNGRLRTLDDKKSQYSKCSRRRNC